MRMLSTSHCVRNVGTTKVVGNLMTKKESREVFEHLKDNNTYGASRLQQSFKMLVIVPEDKFKEDTVYNILDGIYNWVDITNIYIRKQETSYEIYAKEFKNR